MIKVTESTNNDFGYLKDLLNDQGYDMNDLIESIINDLRSDIDKFPNIYYALDTHGDVYDKNAQEFVTEYIINFIKEFIINNDEVYEKADEYDIIDLIIEIVDNNIEEFDYLEDHLKNDGYEDRQLKIWKDEEDDLSSWINSPRM